jgi:hypothetical protein
LSDEQAVYILKDAVANIFDSNSEFWYRPPWVKKDDIKRGFHPLTIDDLKAGDAEEESTLEQLGNVNIGRERISSSDFVSKTGVFKGIMQERLDKLEKPHFMNTEPLFQLHVDRPEQTGSSVRFMYYDNEITSIIRYAHCSGKFQNFTMDIVKRELFPVVANAAILEEVAPANVGFEWETIGQP